MILRTKKSLATGLTGNQKMSLLWQFFNFCWQIIHSFETMPWYNANAGMAGACKRYPSPSRDGDKSVRFQNKRYLQQLRKINARDPSGSKQSEVGACAPNEYGSAVLYGFPPQYSKKNYGCGSYPHSQLWNSWSGFARRRWIGNLFTQTFITKGGGCYGIESFRKPLPCNLYIHHADRLRPQRQH